MNKAQKMKGIILLLMSISVVGVSAYVYQQATLSVTQTVKEIATISLNNPALGNINEGQTLTYTKSDVSDLGNAIALTTTTSNVYLHLSSNLDTQTSTYNTYNVVVLYATVPAGSSHTVGDTACTLSISSPTSSGIQLDAAGTWKFDFQITTMAKSVNADTPTTVSINVTAEST